MSRQRLFAWARVPLWWTDGGECGGPVWGGVREEGGEAVVGAGEGGVGG